MSSQSSSPFLPLSLLVLLLGGCDSDQPVASVAAAEPSLQVDAAVLSGLQHDIEQALVVWEVPGAAVVVVVHDHVLYSRGFGYRNLAKEQVVTPRTLFQVPAATPSLTSSLVGTLVDDNQLEWDSPVGEVSSSLLAFAGNVDLATLMSLPSSDAEVAGVQADPPYMLAASAAAGRLSEDALDERAAFHHLMQRKLFGPAGMTMTALGNQLPAMSEDFATPYHNDKGQLVALYFSALSAGMPVTAASTATDMARFLILHIEGGIAQSGKRVASPTNLAATRKPRRELESSARALWPLAGKAGRGMGWVTLELAAGGQKWSGWNGGADGFSAQAGFLEESGIGLVILNNKDPSSGGVAFNAEVRDRLIARLLGVAYPPPSSHL